MNFTIKKRSLSRLMAVQILYQYFFFEEKKQLNEIRSEIADYYLKENSNKNINNMSSIADVDFLTVLLNEIFVNLEKVNNAIKEFVKESKETDTMLKQILRLGVLELTIMKDVPKNVVINEYVNITSKFYDKNVINFVNGVLENVGAKSA